MHHRARRRSSKGGLLALFSGGGGVVLLVVIIVVKLVLYGVAETAYERDCEDVRWQAYDRYAAYGSDDYVAEVVDTLHNDVVAAATEDRYRSTAKLNRRLYFEIMDAAFDELSGQGASGPRGPGGW
jgi:hypothetical protein